MPSILSKITFFHPSGLVRITHNSLGLSTNPCLSAQELVLQRRVPSNPPKPALTRSSAADLQFTCKVMNTSPSFIFNKRAFSLLKIFIPVELHLSGTEFSNQGAG